MSSNLKVGARIAFGGALHWRCIRLERWRRRIREAIWAYFLELPLILMVLSAALMNVTSVLSINKPSETGGARRPDCFCESSSSDMPLTTPRKVHPVEIEYDDLANGEHNFAEYGEEGPCHFFRVVGFVHLDFGFLEANLLRDTVWVNIKCGVAFEAESLCSPRYRGTPCIRRSPTQPSR